MVEEELLNTTTTAGAPTIFQNVVKASATTAAVDLRKTAPKP
jgi:hypothetical protein